MVCPIDLSNKDPLEALERVGELLVRFRSTGFTHPTTKNRVTYGNYLPSGRFDPDKANLLAWAQNGQANFVERAVFGMPHGLFRSAANVTLQLAPLGENDKMGRRASPLFVHLHRFPSGHHAVVFALLPARFLPPGTPVGLRVNGTLAPGRITWPDDQAYDRKIMAPIHEFLDFVCANGVDRFGAKPIDIPAAEI